MSPLHRDCCSTMDTIPAAPQTPGANLMVTRKRGKPSCIPLAPPDEAPCRPKCPSSSAHLVESPPCGYSGQVPPRWEQKRCRYTVATRDLNPPPVPEGNTVVLRWRPVRILWSHHIEDCHKTVIPHRLFSLQLRHQLIAQV